MTVQEIKSVDMLASDDIRVAGDFVAKDKPFTCSPNKAVELLNLGKARYAKEAADETEKADETATASKGTTKAAK